MSLEAIFKTGWRSEVSSNFFLRKSLHSLTLSDYWIISCFTVPSEAFFPVENCKLLGLRLLQMKSELGQWLPRRLEEFKFKG